MMLCFALCFVFFFGGETETIFVEYARVSQKWIMKKINHLIRLLRGLETGLGLAELF